MHGLHVNRSLRLRLNLFPNASDVYIHAAGRDGAIVTPDAVQKMVPRKDHSWMRGKIVQQPKLQRTEFHLLTRDTDRMQQAARVSDESGFFLTGRLVEFSETKRLFTAPSNRETEDYITGRFG